MHRPLCTLLLAGLFAAAFTAGRAADGKPAFHIVGYLPEYRLSAFNPDRARYVTDLVYFSVEPPTSDEVDGVYFNGPETIRRKTRLAIDKKLGGVMIWELGQDAADEQSLLKVIDRAASDGP